MENSDLIPLFLFSNEKNSFISTDKNFKHSYMDFITTFYVINPKIVPRPIYTDLICVTNVNDTTISITSLYDPFNKDVKCLKFLAWIEATPCTTPLYIRKSASDIHISFENKEIPGYSMNEPFTIFVFTDKYPNINCRGEFKKINNIPQFTFSESYGKCIPDPEGKLTLNECTKRNIADQVKIGKQPDVISYLENRYGKKEIKINSDIILIILSSLFVLFLILWIIKKMKK